MKGKMKVQNFYEPLVMKYEEHDIPQIADNEVLVKVMACSICGSDVSYYYGHSPLGTSNGKGPLYLGHEMSGVVVEIGALPAKGQSVQGGGPRRRQSSTAVQCLRVLHARRIQCLPQQRSHRGYR